MAQNFKQLKEVAKEIFSGLPLYGIERMGEDPEGLPLINIKDVSEGTVKTDQCHRLALGDFKNASRYLVSPGDVVVTCRGSLLKAAVIPGNVERALITSNLIAMRLNDYLLPEYLSTYINIKEGQKKLLANATSSDSRLVLTVSDIEEFEVPILTLPAQRQIIELSQFSAEQYRLNLDVALTRKQVTEKIIEELLNK